MLVDNQILIGKAEEENVLIIPSMLNRHGFICGASGTGKTITLKVLAENLSDLGVPTIIADVKSDLTGMIKAGDMSKIQDRLDSMKVTGFTCNKYPVQFFDVYQTNGHPMRAKVSSIGPMLMSRMLDLSDTQEGVINIVFKIAEDMNLGLFDLKDLKAMLSYVGEHASEYTTSYGNISKQSVGAIQRQLLVLEQAGGDLFLGEPALDIFDMIKTQDSKGVMNIIECEKLFQSPVLYSSFLLWLLSELYDTLPEVGDLDKPKLVFFFDEAHLLFDDATKPLMAKIEQIVKLIRSKGVGVFFITQNPSDIPADVQAQLSNRIQHSLRAYTPAEIKAAKLAASSFRENPKFKTEDVLSNMKTGQALVSVLDKDGAPTIVQMTKIMPPSSMMGVASPDEIKNCIYSDLIAGKYEKTIDSDSAYEHLDEIEKQEEQAKADAKAQKEQAKEEKSKQKTKASSDPVNRIAKKTINRAENEVSRQLVKAATGLLKGFLK